MQNSTIKEIVQRVRRQGSDDGSVEVKSCGQGFSKDIWATVSAFANTKGGLLLLGLDEEAGFISANGFNLDKILDQFFSGMATGGSEAKLLNPPKFNISREEIDAAPVLVISILENQKGQKPCSVVARGLMSGSYKRIDDKNILLSATEIYEMQNALLKNYVDRRPVAGTSKSDLNEDTVGALLQSMAGSRALRGVEGRVAQLRRLNIIAENGELTLAGLMALGDYPQQFLPRLIVDVAVHPTNEKSGSESNVRFEDRNLCDGTIPEQVEQAVASVVRNLRTHSFIEGSGRVSHLEIPVEVLREGIANAVLHRQYEDLFHGRSVAVDVFPDRVEITSPGGLWGGKTLQNIGDGNSEVRNTALLSLLQHVPASSGFTVEGQGSGVPLMIRQLQRSNMAPPLFIESPDQVKVVIYRHGSEIPEFREWLEELTGKDLTQHEDAALIYAKQKGSVTVNELKDLLRIDSVDASNLLDSLQDEQLLRRTQDETFVLSEGAPLPEGSELTVLQILMNGDEPLNVHEIALAADRSVSAVRPILRNLVGKGWIYATAPPTSRNRKYAVKN